jgi:uncharacterized protein (DUF1697 family)
MARFVALLRGVNVGKAKRVAMADLRALLESLGYSGVRTLLNSGNAVFDASARSPATHARRIQGALARDLGVDVLVIVKSAEDLAAVIAGNGLEEGASDPSRLLVAFTHDAPSLAALQSLASLGCASDKLLVGEHAAYVWCANGLLESKVAVAMLGGLGASGTTRNWATVTKLQALLQADA